jgi:tRNA(Ile)-lysidine synthase TilS/MesJ
MDSLTNFWLSNRKLWFYSTPETDAIVIEHTKEYFQNYDLIKNLTILGQIIFHDQIIRHYVRRIQSNSDNDISDSSSVIIELNNKKAINLCNKLLESNEILNYSPIERCFALMPLRHSEDETDRIRVIHIIEEYMNMTDKEQSSPDPDYLRFYQASLERVRDPYEIISLVDFPIYLVCKSSTFDLSRFLDTTYSEINIEDIPIEFIDGFKKAINIDNTSNASDNEITISISGGSDSMLCLFIAWKMGYKVKALMIDYCNRLEHIEEVNFVSLFCQKLNVEFYVRPISEMKRHRDSTREFYETVTKNIRFRSYKFLGNPVVLGHNLDDCFENCITNIMTKRSKDNIFGMKPVSDQMGVSIRRPLLDIPKSQIVLLCNRFNIPYLLDSTPKWSRRGRIRDIVVPALKEFDVNLIPRIMEFCEESSKSLQDYQDILESYPITESYYQIKTKINKEDTINDKENKHKHEKPYKIDVRTQLSFSIDCRVEYFNQNIRFWQGMVNRITDIFNIKRIRISTIESMINTFITELNNEHNQREIKVSLSNDLICFINVSRTDIIFRLKEQK